MEESLQLWEERCQPFGKTVRLHLLGASAAALLAELSSKEPDRPRSDLKVSVFRIEEAELCASLGCTDILVTDRVVTPAELDRAAALNRKLNLRIACDHFVQVEAFSRACQRARTIGKVLIEVNLGLDCFGIRAGSDMRELSGGIVTLPGVKLVGVMGRVDLGESAQSNVTAQYDINSRMPLSPGLMAPEEVPVAWSLLAQMAAQVRRKGIFIDEISVGGTAAITAVATLSLTEIRISAARLFPSISDPRSRSDDSVLGTIVCRPKLERAILNVGRRQICCDPLPELILQRTGRRLADLNITCVGDEFLRLELGPISQDLHIGDQLLVNYKGPRP